MPIGLRVRGNDLQPICKAAEMNSSSRVPLRGSHCPTNIRAIPKAYSTTYSCESGISTIQHQHIQHTSSVGTNRFCRFTTSTTASLAVMAQTMVSRTTCQKSAPSHARHRVSNSQRFKGCEMTRESLMPHVSGCFPRGTARERSNVWHLMGPHSIVVGARVTW